MKANQSLPDRYKAASLRVKEIKGFYLHLSTYCTIIPFLILINYITNWEFRWFWLPMAGWGIGLVSHWIVIFGFGKNWEQRKIKEILRNDDNLIKK